MDQSSSMMLIYLEISGNMPAGKTLIKIFTRETKSLVIPLYTLKATSGESEGLFWTSDSNVCINIPKNIPNAFSTCIFALPSYHHLCLHFFILHIELYLLLMLHLIHCILSISCVYRGWMMISLVLSTSKKKQNTWPLVKVHLFTKH